MRCSAKIKDKTTKKGYRICGNDLDDKAIFCDVCGRPTNALKEGLSGWNNFKSVIKLFPEIFKIHYFKGIIAAILILLIAFGIIFKINFNSQLLFLIVLSVVSALILQVLFSESVLFSFSIKGFIREYSAFLKFVLINILYFNLLKILCTGFLLNVATDPILHIIRLILVIYWLVIILPVPVLIAKGRGDILNVIIESYKAGKETRWQQFFLLVFIAGLNIIGLLTIVGLALTLVAGFLMIKMYVKNMKEYRLFD